MRIFHLATEADWRTARAAGRYTTSTRGRTLAEEGFIHASRGDQWQAVRERFYADLDEPLVLLVIDTELLDVPVVEEPAEPGGRETFPHLYGALSPDAVVSVVPLEPRGGAGDVPGPADPGPADPGPADPGPVDPGPVGPRDPAARGPSGTGASFSRVFLTEVFHQVWLASVVMVLVVLGALVGLVLAPGWGPLLGTLAGLLAGVVLARALSRRRRRRRLEL